MWDFIATHLANWLRFYENWAVLKYNSFGPRMYGYMLAVVLVFGLYLMRSGPRQA